MHEIRLAVRYRKRFRGGKHETVNGLALGRSPSFKMEKVRLVPGYQKGGGGERQLHCCVDVFRYWKSLIIERPLVTLSAGC